MGYFIAICGIDGSGKSTLVRELQQTILMNGKSVIVEAQPTTWFLRQKIDVSRLTPVEAIAFFSADRGYDQPVLAQQIDNYDFVIRDRYAPCTYAYNCYDPQTTALFKGLNQNFIEPDLTVLLDIPVDIALARIEERNNSRLGYLHQKEVLEEAKARYKRKISLINSAKSLVLDGELPVEQLVEQILSRAEGKCLRSQPYLLQSH